MCATWRVIEYIFYSKTRHVCDMVSYRIQIVIENSPCVRHGELSNTLFNRKLAMCATWRVIEYKLWSKTHHVCDMASYRIHFLIENSHLCDMASYRIHFLIENSPCVQRGELSNTFFNRKLAICATWRVIEYILQSNTSHVCDMFIYYRRTTGFEPATLRTTT